MSQLLHLLLGAHVDPQFSVAVNFVVWEFVRVKEQSLRSVVVLTPFVFRLGLMLVLQIQVLLRGQELAVSLVLRHVEVVGRDKSVRVVQLARTNRKRICDFWLAFFLN